MIVGSKPTIFPSPPRLLRKYRCWGAQDPHPSLSRKRARVHIWCTLDRKVPSPILMGEGYGEGNFIVCGRAKPHESLLRKYRCISQRFVLLRKYRARRFSVRDEACPSSMSSKVPDQVPISRVARSAYRGMSLRPSLRDRRRSLLGESVELGFGARQQPEGWATG